MAIQSYNTLVDALTQFSTNHLTLKRFKCSFFEQLDNFSTEDNQFPILYAIPSDVAFDTNIDEFSFRVYCVDILQKDRSNESPILNETLLVLRDLTNWLRLDQDNNLNIINTPVATPVNNFLTEYTTGWYVDITIEATPETSDCAIPFSDNFIFSGVTCAGTYVTPYLTCDTLAACSSFISLGNRVSVLESNSGHTANYYTTGFTYDNINTFTITDNNGGSFDSTVSVLSGVTYYGDGSNLTGLPDPDLTPYIPYTGATRDVDLGSNSLTVGTTTIDGSLSATTISSATIDIKQLSDNSGITVYGYDDMSASTGTFYIDSVGNTRFGATGIVAFSPTNETQFTGGLLNINNNNGIRVNDADASHTGRVLKLGSNSDYGIGYYPTDDTLQITDGGIINTNVRVAIDNTGNVGIGTSTPTSKLHVVGDATIDGSLSATTISVGTLSATTKMFLPGAGIVTAFIDDQDTGISSSGNNAISLIAGGATVLYANTTGFRFPTGKKFANSNTGNPWLNFTGNNPTANSPTNYFDIENAASGGTPTLSSSGNADADVDFNIGTKGNGKINLLSEVTASGLTETTTGTTYNNLVIDNVGNVLKNDYYHIGVNFQITGTTWNYIASEPFQIDSIDESVSMTYTLLHNGGAYTFGDPIALFDDITISNNSQPGLLKLNTKLI